MEINPDAVFDKSTELDGFFESDFGFGKTIEVAEDEAGEIGAFQLLGAPVGRQDRQCAFVIPMSY